MKHLDEPLAASFFWERRTKGDVGIEVEIEGGPWPEGPIKNWVTHQDGSLRNGIEYVIRQPVSADRVRASVQVLADGLAATNKVFSYRTSVHVHINVQHLTTRQWVNFVTLFTILEKLLVNQVGPERAGNKFCLRMCDAEQPLDIIRNGVLLNRLRDHLNGDLKYASMNVRATRTHGTLEFRAMKGNLDVGFITDWVGILVRLRDEAIKAENPAVFVEQVSMLGAEEFVRRYTPADSPIMWRVLRDPELNNDIYEGVRLVQDIAYCTDWGKPRVADGKIEAAQAPMPDPDFDFDGWDQAEPMQEAGVRLADIRWNPLPAGNNIRFNGIEAQLAPAPVRRPIRILRGADEPLAIDDGNF